jgi:hypothetical protein
MRLYLEACQCDSCKCIRSFAALADGAVADHLEPVAAEAGIVGAQPDGDDLDTMAHDA